MRPIADVARSLDLPDDAIIPWGRGAAKVDPAVLDRPDGRGGRVVLVSAINPTPAGEGKTTTSVGLAQALHRGGERVIAALREPSLGPCFESAERTPSCDAWSGHQRRASHGES